MEEEPVDALVLDARDNVATALRPLAAGEPVRIAGPAGRLVLVAREPVPLCHKLALADLEAGALVVKHGEPIGELLEPVSAGALVHVHNLRSRLARPAGSG